MNSIGLFIFGMTADPDIHWIGGVIGITLIGFGIYMIFFPSLNYIVDAFLQYTASAVAANTLFRSFFGAAFRKCLAKRCMLANIDSTFRQTYVSKFRCEEGQSHPGAVCCIPLSNLHRISQVWGEDQKEVEVCTNRLVLPLDVRILHLMHGH